MRGGLITAALAFIMALVPASAACHETDQYSVPSGREFADLRFYLSDYVYKRLAAAVEATNARIEGSLRDGKPTKKTAKLQSPEVMAGAVSSAFPSVVYLVETWEMNLRAKEVKSEFPGMVVTYKPTFWIYHHPLLILDPTKLVRLRRTSTIMVDGTYFGTDKIPHFFDMGHIYYRTYRHAIRKGLGEKEATRRAVRKSAGRNLIFSESAILGGFTTGVRSNADLAANFAGLKFYRNLTEEVSLKGRMRPPLLLREGLYWRLNDHVKPHSDFFSVFVSDHFDEALNPNTYILGMTTIIRNKVRDRCDDLVAWYRDDEGRPGTRERFEEIAKKLSTYYGEDYGYRKNPDRMATIADTCFPGGDGQGPAPTVDAGNTAQRAEEGVDSADRLGRTALWWAARFGRTDEVRRLIALGADVNARDIDGETPLHAAVRWGQAEAAEALLQNGANADARAIYGTTPLHMAARELRADLVGVLLAHGASADARDDFGCTPLHDVASRGDEALAASLVRAGANPDSGDVLGTTPLHRAARAGNAGVEARLIALGADPAIRSSLGRTPREEAIKGDGAGRGGGDVFGYIEGRVRGDE
ncbi:MAG: ankyrin repeat domain-containing protein [Nitrospirota bacterium]